jgi:hypothetical protein
MRISNSKTKTKDTLTLTLSRTKPRERETDARPDAQTVSCTPDDSAAIAPASVMR